MAQQVVICHRVWQPEFDPFDPQGGRRRLLQIVLRCVCARMYTHLQCDLKIKKSTRLGSNIIQEAKELLLPGLVLYILCLPSGNNYFKYCDKQTDVCTCWLHLRRCLSWLIRKGQMTSLRGPRHKCSTIRLIALNEQVYSKVSANDAKCPGCLCQAVRSGRAGLAI